MPLPLTLRVNTQACTANVEPRTHLADFLREELLLTGTHLGCEHGVCGACTLMLDGRPVRSCLTLAATCAGAEVRTIEGFDDDTLMVALRRAFSRHHALQCGYCTPGMLVSAYDIVRRLPGADEPRVRAELAGNLCRCTGYAGIVAAIVEVAGSGIAAPLQPSDRAAVASSTRTARSQPLEAPTRAWTPPDLTGAVTLSRKLALPLPAEAAWELLRRVETVAGCLPGATLDHMDGEDVAGRLTVAVGPMRATFHGRARVVYDDAAQSGTIAGGADDPATRSAAVGKMAFRVAAAGEGCIVHAEIRYRLSGPFAQAGRPAIVAAVVDQMLGRFTTNLLAAAVGQAGDVRPVGGLRTLAKAVVAALRNAYRRISGSPAGR